VCITPLVPDDNARLFLALWPSPRVRAALLEYRDAWRWNTQASLVRPDKLHLTLHFIGNVPRHRLQQIRKGLEVPFEPFELNFGQPGLWRHGLAVLQPHAIPSSLLQLHDALRQALQRLELPGESTQDFRPHITLARRAVGAVPPDREPVLRWRVRGYALVESMHEPAGQYGLVQRYA
jgi:2'-5' RNA ligase